MLGCREEPSVKSLIFAINNKAEQIHNSILWNFFENIMVLAQYHNLTHI